ncbi:hypothetical protein [Cohnella lupini]|uniref:Uncharacterized protein n=1 Tax=Cohnella lupini TaxID=1294267 RepID=A0A3D9IST2_9BACL|nr:hypothetical protein [Cohnella lupini]RED64822.1 hypothetical protein DFP95_102243 [Cohnella lupini]
MTAPFTCRTVTARAIVTNTTLPASGLQVFTMDGRHKRFIDDNMDAPCSFYYYGDEVVFPDLNSRVTILDRNDKRSRMDAIWPDHEARAYLIAAFSQSAFGNRIGYFG